MHKECQWITGTVNTFPIRQEHYPQKTIHVSFTIVLRVMGY